MTHERNRQHLAEEALQGFLDGSLPEREAVQVRDHVSSCVRCRSELEAWEVLFQDLGELGDLGPSAGFADRVLESLPRTEPETVPLAARIRGWLGLEGRVPPPNEHLDPTRAQDFLDGVLARRDAGAVEAHLHGCRRCREEVDAWRSLMVQLDGVPELAPSDVFAERVMAHVRIRNAVAAARPTTRERLAAWSHGFLVRNRKRMAALAGAAVAPAVTVALVAYAVFSHPLVTVGNLLSFLWLEGQEAALGTMSTLLGGLVQNATILGAWEALQGLIATPGMAVALFALFGITTLTAFWILYRNLIATHSVDGRYAHSSI